MNHLAFVVQIFQTLQNVFHQVQDKPERKPWVALLILQSRNAVAKHVRDETNVLASETLEHELVQEMDDVPEPTMERG